MQVSRRAGGNCLAMPIKCYGIPIYGSRHFGLVENVGFCRCAGHIEFDFIDLIQSASGFKISKSPVFATCIEAGFVVSTAIGEVFAFAQHFDLVGATRLVFRVEVIKPREVVTH